MKPTQSIPLKRIKHLPQLVILLCSLFITVSFAHTSPNQKRHIIAPQPVTTPKIQLAILLDTSGSMDGLIDQTRNQLWQVVNEFSTAKRNGITPVLEVALFEYGNDGNSRDTGFVRMLNNFTRELDKVSEGLFSLTTNGGSEYCGFAIKTAVHSLNWSHSDRDIKTIFIAGNEPFTQGPINYRDALRLAQQHGIAINTIHAGDHQAGIDTGWQSGAHLAGGDYMSIDANRRTVHIIAPQDKRIAELNSQLNNTYVPYGAHGKEKSKRQMAQDEQSKKISAGLLAKRARSKSSSFYNNTSWDLVDAMSDGKVDEDELAKMDKSALPEPMRELTAAQKNQYVEEKSKARKTIKQEIKQLSESRDTYVAEENQKQIAAAPSMSDALTKAIKKQAKEKDYQFEKKGEK
jgi:hypothetical protein